MRKTTNNKMKNETNKNISSDSDWSLQATAYAYRDRHNESNNIVMRILQSSSSVTGIAGRRGAGKSSLALRVLEICKESDYFTQLIHSPTGYDPREFLISVFQRTCDEVIRQLDQKRGEAKVLTELAEKEKLRLTRTRRWLWIIIFILVVGVFIFLLMDWGKRYDSFLDNRIGVLTTEINSLRTDVATKIESFLKDTETLYQSSAETANEFPKQLRADLENLVDELKNVTPNDDIFEFMNWELRDMAQLLGPDNFLFDLLPQFERLSELHFEQTFLKRQRWISVEPRLGVWGIPISSLVKFNHIVIVVAFFVVIFILLYLLRYIMRRLKLLRIVSPEEVGLRSVALQLTEHLAYQTTVSTSKEMGVSALRITSKFGIGKSLTTRPLSLPGVTEQFASFLEKICEVYTGGVVICLDELDKIADPEDLDQLLRGIKGILGRRETHFLFTVSEDAIIRFTTRRRAERGIVESAFEDITILEHIDLRLADYVLQPMYPLHLSGHGEDGKIHPSTKLLWLFGGGIPREVKRNARVCLELDVQPKENKLIEVWKLLFQQRIDDMKSWAVRVERDEQITSHFLSCLYDCESNFKEMCDFNREWVSGFVKIWLEDFASKYSFQKVELSKRSPADSEILIEQEMDVLIYGRAVIELVIGGSAMLFAVECHVDGEFAETSTNLERIFAHIPSNFGFAWENMHEYLKALDVL